MSKEFEKKLRDPLGREFKDEAEMRKCYRIEEKDKTGCEDEPIDE